MLQWPPLELATSHVGHRCNCYCFYSSSCSSSCLRRRKPLGEVCQPLNPKQSVSFYENQTFYCATYLRDRFLGLGLFGGFIEECKRIVRVLLWFPDGFHLQDKVDKVQLNFKEPQRKPYLVIKEVIGKHSKSRCTH